MDRIVTEEMLSELLRKAREGSQEALGALLEHFRPYLLRIAQEELSSDLHVKEPPSDVVQQSFLEASLVFDRGFRGATSLEVKAWLKQILRNNVRDMRDRYHAEKRHVSRETPLNGLNATEDYSSPQSSPSGSAIRRERADAVEAALLKLSPQTRELIELRHRHSLGFATIGERLGISEQAARKRWARAVEELRSMVQIHFDSSSR